MTFKLIFKSLIITYICIILLFVTFPKLLLLLEKKQEIYKITKHKNNNIIESQKRIECYKELRGICICKCKE